MAETTEGTFTCDHCKRSYAWKTHLAGKRVACKCGERITVPEKPTPRKAGVAASPSPSKPLTAKAAPPKAKAAPPKAEAVTPKAKAPSVKPGAAASNSKMTSAKPKDKPAAPVVVPSASKPQWNVLQSAADPAAIHTAITPGFRATQYKAPRRIGLILVGLMSILFGLISAAVNLFSAEVWRTNWQESVPRSVVSKDEGPPLPPPTFPPYSGSTSRSTGLSKSECTQITAATPFDGPVGEQRREMLNHLLSEAGTLIMPNLASDTLRPIAPSATAPDTPDRPVRFLTPRGTVTVHQNWAKYESENQPVVFVDKNIATINGTTYLTTSRIDQNIRQLRAQLPKITNMQLAFVADYLIHHSFNPDADNAGEEYNAQNAYSTAALGGVKILAIRIQGVDLLVLPNGRGTLKKLAPKGLDIITNCPMNSPFQEFQPKLPGDPDFMLWLSICCMAAAVLAVYLVLAGIITLISPQRWARLHMTYAIICVVLILVQAALSVSLYTSITAANAKAVNSFDTGVVTQWLIAISAAQIIYPLMLVVIYMRNPRLGKRAI